MPDLEDRVKNLEIAVQQLTKMIDYLVENQNNHSQRTHHHISEPKITPRQLNIDFGDIP